MLTVSLLVCRAEQKQETPLRPNGGLTCFASVGVQTVVYNPRHTGYAETCSRSAYKIVQVFAVQYLLNHPHFGHRISMHPGRCVLEPLYSVAVMPTSWHYRTAWLSHPGDDLCPLKTCTPCHEVFQYTVYTTPGHTHQYHTFFMIFTRILCVPFRHNPILP